MNKRVVNFQHEKNRQEGIITAEMLREHMDNWIEDYGKVRHMIVLYVYDVPNDETQMQLSVAYTNLNRMELMGYLDWAKQTIEHGEEEE